ncbi:Agamous-like MADS-box protein AGL62 [Linum grandiflorum]
MKKIEKNTDLSISFSKRKSGICKKGNELATLTGCKIGFLAFSPSGKPVTFANPSFDYIVESYLGEIHNQQPDPLMEVFRHDRIDQFTNRYADMLNQSGNRDRQTTDLLAMLEGRSLNKWWNKSIDNVQGHEIEGLANAYLDRWNMVEQSRREKMLEMDGFVQTDSINGVPNSLQPQPNMGGPILLEPVPDFSMVGLPSDGGEDTGSFSAVGPNGGGEA